MTENRKSLTDVIRNELKKLPEGQQDDLMQAVKYLSEDALEKIKYALLNRGDTGLEETIKFCQQHKLFKVEPRLVVDKGWPVLMLRSNTFLSWFRGEWFQVSGDEEGHGAYGDSDHTLSRDLEVTKYSDDFVRNAVVFGHMAQAATKYPQFRELVLSKPDHVTDFVLATNDLEYMNVAAFNVNHLWREVTRFTDLTEFKKLKEISLVARPTAKRKGGVFAKLVLGSDFVAVRRTDEDFWNLIEFECPWQKVDKRMENWSMSECMQTLWTRMTWLLLFMGRVVMDWRITYTSDDCKYVPVETLTSDMEKIECAVELNEVIDELSKRYTPEVEQAFAGLVRVMEQREFSEIDVANWLDVSPLAVERWLKLELLPEPRLQKVLGGWA